MCFHNKSRWDRIVFAVYVMTSCRFELRPAQGEPGGTLLKTILLHDGKEVIVGRNSVTGLDTIDSTQDADVVYVSRMHAKVEASGCKVFVTPCSSQKGMVYINSKRCQNHVPVEAIAGQDLLTLLGPKNKYSFTIHDRQSVSADLSVNTEDSSKSPGSQTTSLCESTFEGQGIMREIGDEQEALEPINKTDDHVNEDLESRQKKRMRRDKEQNHAETQSSSSSSTAVVASTSIANTHLKIKEGMECPICMNYMALSHTVIPCGHCFCFTCIDDWQAKSELCPTCQSTLKGLVPNFIVDQTIQDILMSDDHGLPILISSLSSPLSPLLSSLLSSLSSLL